LQTPLNVIHDGVIIKESEDKALFCTMH